MADDKNRAERSMGEVSKAIGGSEENKFTSVLSAVSGDAPADSQDMGDEGSPELDQGKAEQAKLEAEAMGTAFMEAEDKEDKKLKLKEMEEKAREKETNDAIAIKAAAIAREKATAGQRMVQLVHQDEARRDRDRRQEAVAEKTGTKYLSPELSATMVLDDKRQVR